MSVVDLNIPTFMKKESVESLRKIKENDYDYQNVEKSLNEATKKMVNKSIKQEQHK